MFQFIHPVKFANEKHMRFGIAARSPEQGSSKPATRYARVVGGDIRLRSRGCAVGGGAMGRCWLRRSRVARAESRKGGDGEWDCSHAADRTALIKGDVAEE